MSNVIQFPGFDRDEEQRRLAVEIAEVQRLTESIAARMRRLNPPADPDALSITQRMRVLELEEA